MAIGEVLKGKRYLSPELSGKVIEGYLDGRKTYQVQSVFDKLTKREREIMKMIADTFRAKRPHPPPGPAKSENLIMPQH